MYYDEKIVLKKSSFLGSTPKPKYLIYTYNKLSLKLVFKSLLSLSE